jgi:hypothetical protein
MTLTSAHIAGIPVEEGVLALVPAGAAIVSVVALVAKARLAEIVAWRRRL